jgi:glutaredoxin
MHGKSGESSFERRRRLAAERSARVQSAGMAVEEPAVSERDMPASHALLGTTALIAGAALACVVFAERTGGLPFDLPRAWYVNRPLWYGAMMACFVAGWALLRGRRTLPAAIGSDIPAVGRVVLYTKHGCHLCDEAKAVLQRYSRFLPAVIEIDIESDPQLVEEFGTCVPVVEIDGRVRFRGRINEVLLRRIIDHADSDAAG